MNYSRVGSEATPVSVKFLQDASGSRVDIDAEVEGMHTLSNCIASSPEQDSSSLTE